MMLSPKNGVMRMKYDLVIFDLDGTLLDTVEDLRAALNYALARAGYPEKTKDEMKRIIGGGVYNHVVNALPGGTEKPIVDAVFAEFKARYHAHCNDTTLPFPGVIDMLKALKGAGIKVAVNSNKLDQDSRTLVDIHFPGLVDMAIGDREGVPRKPDPRSANEIMAALHVQPERTLYVGDGDSDILTARNAGTDGAWVSWGYRKQDELGGASIPRRFDDVETLRAYILGA